MKCPDSSRRCPKPHARLPGLQIHNRSATPRPHFTDEKTKSQRWYLPAVTQPVSGDAGIPTQVLGFPHGAVGGQKIE